MCLVEVPAKYKTVTRKVIKTPATTKEVEVPAEYKTQKVSKLVKPAQERRIKVEPTYETLSKRVLVSEEKFFWHPDWEEKPGAGRATGNTICLRETTAKTEVVIDASALATSPAAAKTQIIAIYGKGGIGKSFTLANLSYMMAQQGKKVLLIGCDPKSDTTSLLFGGKACPAIIETSSKKKLAGEPVEIGDVCFKRDGVYAMELGGPEVGRGCGGRGIIHGFELLEKLGFHEWDFDYVLLDFLGDVVCGGFGLPIARDMAQKVILVGSNDLQSLYVANNVCSAVEYFRKLGGNVGVAGLVINKDDGSGEAQAFDPLRVTVAPGRIGLR